MAVEVYAAEAASGVCVCGCVIVRVRVCRGENSG